MHVNGDEGGRYALTGVGDVNTYALFSETILQITDKSGRAGFIVPTGIATDDSTKAFFSYLTQNSMLVQLLAFENEEFIFPSVHHSFRFCMLTIGISESAEFVFFARQPSQVHDIRRRFTLSPDEFRLINPNTLTCPVFRSERDAEITKKIYRAAPVLIDENRDDGNPWGVSFMTMFHMSADSHLFQSEAGEGLLPLYEAKMIHQYDHRWATYHDSGDTRDASELEKADPSFAVTPRYWIDEQEVGQRLMKRGRDGNILWRWSRGWIIGWRDVTSAHVLRTVISSVVPRVGIGNKMPLLFCSEALSIQHVAALFGNLNSLVLDYVARQKVGGISLTYFYLKQFPLLSPNQYTSADLDYIVSRVVELTYTTYDLEAWARDLDYHDEPFEYEPGRRAILRAQLDAYYARLYGLDREELRYILDPSDIMGEDYPSESFRVLKNKEIKEFGEYRTQRLVLEAWDKLHQEEGTQHTDSYRIAAQQQPVTNSADLADGAWLRPGLDQRAETGVQLIALLKSANAPLPIRQLRLLATLAMEPRLMLPLLDQDKASEWQRLIGDDARALSTNVLSFASRSNQDWGAAVRNLRTNGYLVENLQGHTWEPGQNAHDFVTPQWADGRANWVLELVQSVDTETLLMQLPEEAREWINAAA